MAEEREPLLVREAGYTNSRYQFAPNGTAALNLGSIEEPDVVSVPRGISEVLLQARRCGDVYAEANGPGLCISVVAGDTPQAVRDLLMEASK